LPTKNDKSAGNFYQKKIQPLGKYSIYEYLYQAWNNRFVSFSLIDFIHHQGTGTSNEWAKHWHDHSIVNPAINEYAR
jgi:hypothetical protein